jgi:hypothetical protein
MIDAMAILGAVLGVIGAWLVACAGRRARWWGFACFLASNVAWIAWGLVTAGGWPLVAMQLAFCVTSARGLWTCRRQVEAIIVADDYPHPGVQTVIKGDGTQWRPGDGVVYDHAVRAYRKARPDEYDALVYARAIPAFQHRRTTAPPDPA